MDFSIDEMNKFVEALASDAPTPGGGSVSALCGALASGLASMSANFTAGREKYKDKEKEMQQILHETKALCEEFMHLIQEDIDAYGFYSKAVKMPKETEEEKAMRKATMQRSLRASTEIPLKMIEACVKVEQLALLAVKDANPFLISDSAASAVIAEAAANAASYNVRINLPGISDTELAVNYSLRMKSGLETVAKLAAESKELIDKHFAKANG